VCKGTPNPPVQPSGETTAGVVHIAWHRVRIGRVAAGGIGEVPSDAADDGAGRSEGRRSSNVPTPGHGPAPAPWHESLVRTG